MQPSQTHPRTFVVPQRLQNLGLWLLQLALAALFAMAGLSKLGGNPEMVALFDQIGIGQWFRYVTGFLQLTAAALLLTPTLSALGGLILTAVMLGAVFTHLAVIGGSPLTAVVLLALAALVAWSRRAQLGLAATN